MSTLACLELNRYRATPFAILSDNHRAGLPDSYLATELRNQLAFALHAKMLGEAASHALIVEACVLGGWRRIARDRIAQGWVAPNKIAPDTIAPNGIALHSVAPDRMALDRTALSKMILDRMAQDSCRVTALR